MEIIHDATKDFDDITICPCCYEEIPKVKVTETGDTRTEHGRILPTTRTIHRNIFRCVKCGSKWYDEPTVVTTLSIHEIIGAVKLGCNINMIQAFIAILVTISHMVVLMIDGPILGVTTRIVGINVPYGWFLCACNCIIIISGGIVEYFNLDNTIPHSIRLKSKNKEC